MSWITRRLFLGAGAGLLGAPALAIEPIGRPAVPKLRLSLAAYSMRKFLTAPAGSPGAMDLEGFVDWAAGLDLDAVELTSYYFPKSVTLEYLAGLKRRCHLAGLDISGGAVGNNFTLPDDQELQKQVAGVEAWIGHYATLGVPVIRVFAGSPPAGVSEDQAIARAVETLQRVCVTAGKAGLMLGLENHDFLTKGSRLKQIVEGVKSPWFGVNLDTGNFHSADPYADMEAFAPYAVNVQVKVSVTPEGKPAQPADLARIVGILRRARYSGYVVLEYEEEPDPYEAVPKYLKAMRQALAEHL